MNLTEKRPSELFIPGKNPRFISHSEFSELGRGTQKRLVDLQVFALSYKNHQFLDPLILQEFEIEVILRRSTLLSRIPLSRLKIIPDGSTMDIANCIILTKNKSYTKINNAHWTIHNLLALYERVGIYLAKEKRGMPDHKGRIS